MAAIMRTSVVTAPSRSVRSVSTVQAVRAVRPVVIARASPAPAKTQQKVETVETAIKEAEEACKDGSTGECAAAWDNVEEISAASNDKRQATKEGKVDPLDQFCAGDPSADECRVYED